MESPCNLLVEENTSKSSKGRKKSPYKLSDEGKKIIDVARLQQGWNKMDVRWAKEGLSSRSTLKRFLNGVPISAEHFVTLCKAVGIEDWSTLIDWDTTDSTKVPKSIQEKLEKQESELTVSHQTLAAGYGLVVTSVFHPGDLQEIEIAFHHLLKLMQRGTVTITNQDGKVIREFRHRSQG